MVLQKKQQVAYFFLLFSKRPLSPGRPEKGRKKESPLIFAAFNDIIGLLISIYQKRIL